MKKILFSLILIIFAANLIGLRPALADGFLPNCDTGAGSRPCQLNDFLVLGSNLIKYMMGIAGSLALLFFVYGGFKMILSAGNSSKVDEGKNMIVAATIGLLIVLSSWVIIDFTYKSLMKNSGSKVKFEWWKT